MKKPFHILMYLAVFLPCTSNAAGTVNNIPDMLKVADFSSMVQSDITPSGWHPLNFESIENKTAYFLIRQQNITVVQAVSHASASGFIKKVNISSTIYPVIKWRWKIDDVLNKGDIMTKEGDDYSARIYVSFDYDPHRLTGIESLKYKLYKLVHDESPPLAVINYVWGNHAHVGTTVNNAYSDRVKMIVIQSGKKRTKQWVHEERNILEDYRRVFGEDPGNITGIAIMTDTDNTGESATAWYGDISFHKSND